MGRPLHQLRCESTAAGPACARGAGEGRRGSGGILEVLPREPAGVLGAVGKDKAGVKGTGCLLKYFPKLIHSHFSNASREDPSPFLPSTSSRRRSRVSLPSTPACLLPVP